MIEAAKGRLKVVGRAGVGIDNVDLAAASEVRRWGCWIGGWGGAAQAGWVGGGRGIANLGPGIGQRGAAGGDKKGRDTSLQPSTAVAVQRVHIMWKSSMLWHA